MKNLILKIFVLLSITLLASCANEYKEHFFREHDNGTYTSTGVFFSTGAELFILPDETLRDELIERIDAARNHIYIEIYLWTDLTLLDAIIRAHERGLDVQVLLEPNVYGLPDANGKTYDRLLSAGIPVRYTDNYRYNFTHAKFMIIDERYYISTGNFTRSFFESNREFIYSGDDILTLGFLEHVFQSDKDYLTVPKSHIPPHILLSPISSREQIEGLILRSSQRIVIYNQTLDDESILSLLDMRQKSGIDVLVCTADNESNREGIHKSALTWKTANKPYLHAKIMIIDEKTLFLGSQNFTKNALENNREVGIIIRDNVSMVRKIQNLIKEDCF